MKNRKPPQVSLTMLALALVLVSSACGRAVETVEDSAQPTSVQGTVTEPAPESEPTADPPTEPPTPGEPVTFEVVPFAAIKSQIKLDMNEVQPGWTYLYLLIAVENVSDGYADFYYNAVERGAYVVTSEGYTYPVEKSFLRAPRATPPGFVVWASYGRWYNFLVFKVAEQTNSYELHLPELPGFSPMWLDEVPTDVTSSDFTRLGLEAAGHRIRRALEDGLSETSSLSLDKVFAPGPSAPDPLETGEPFQFGESGEMTVVSITEDEEEEGWSQINLVYRNTSGGYDQSFDLDFYVFGDRGIVSEGGDVNVWEVGPGQEVEAQCPVALWADAGPVWVVVQPDPRVEPQPEIYRLD